MSGVFLFFHLHLSKPRAQLELNQRNKYMLIDFNLETKLRTLAFKFS